MQMQTEENQKVGRLFEDTKYTGLIAKLKRDGVPSYQGSQLTVTISTPAIGTALPVPLSGTAAIVSPAYSQVVPGQGAPSVPGGPSVLPSAHGHAAPSVPISAPGHGGPSAPGHGGPSAPGHGGPSAPGHGGPSAPGLGAPSVSHKGGQGVPSVPGVSFAAGHGISSPAPVAAAVTPAGTHAAPVAAKKNVVKAVTYEWAPPGVNQSLVRIPPHLC